MSHDADAIFQRTLAGHRDALAALAPAHLQGLERLADDVLAAWDGGGKLLVCGNGGSAADSQHLAAELAGRYLHDRPGWPAVALTTDTSALTAIGNDYGFERIFARQVEALGRPGDVLLVISTSGHSANCRQAARTARQQGLRTHALLGKDGGPLRGEVDGAIVAPGAATPRIQEMHLILIHLLCELLEARRLGTDADPAGADPASADGSGDA
jgi:D-sedoheptulose 7-phosphate isomerase